ncbi:uncharacterized protein A1O9_10714 [Exophiala aquamarina CBS 119918]|uniref:DUF7025 domain-containing protein n=1 Tax=Exophiala aquamarina CBS 119918 TaxID=1182545 RepID=A0A072P0E2_9EURO|nr:uncharacterized protein A1O9_10714 [Exophiala aquamarina CBS 119918]KEF53266.1 hypothetical protein A1O9_10714 [Exophiala aquamarina CBS 119918]
MQPYAQLFWQKEQIKTHREKATKSSTKHELDVILEFIENNPDLERIQSEYSKHESQKMITSDITWTLFPPGTLAVVNMSQMPAQCIKVTSCNYNGKSKVLELRFLIFQFNGREFGNTRRSIAINLPMTAAPYPITDLVIYPIQYHKSGNLQKTLIERGRKYARVVQRAHMDYRGVAWIQDLIDQTTVQTHITGRVMIDYAQYTRQNPSSAPNLESDLGMDFEECELTPRFCGKQGCTFASKKKDEDEPEASNKKGVPVVEEHTAKELEPEQALLCPGRVKGFALTDKTWAEFRVDALEEIKWNNQAYRRLEMDANTESIIKALVESHRKHSRLDAEEFDDIIAGKGLGLVLLLQGTRRPRQDAHGRVGR